MILYRPQRGGLEESMRECREFFTVDEVRMHVAKEYIAMLMLEHEDVYDVETEVESSYLAFDPRTEWPTWLVSVRGEGMGYSNFCLEVKR